jgi:hypothetical protein
MAGEIKPVEKEVKKIQKKEATLVLKTKAPKILCKALAKSIYDQYIHQYGNEGAGQAYAYYQAIKVLDSCNTLTDALNIGF